MLLIFPPPPPPPTPPRNNIDECLVSRLNSWLIRTFENFIWTLVFGKWAWHVFAWASNHQRERELKLENLILQDSSIRSICTLQPARQRERENEWINKLYFTRVMEKTQGLFTSSQRERKREREIEREREIFASIQHSHTQHMCMHAHITYTHTKQLFWSCLFFKIKKWSTQI